MIEITDKKLSNTNEFIYFIETHMNGSIFRCSTDYTPAPLRRYFALEKIEEDLIARDELKNANVSVQYLYGYAQALVNACLLSQKEKPLPDESDKYNAVIGDVVVTAQALHPTPIQGQKDPDHETRALVTIYRLLEKDPVNGTEALFNFYKAMTMQEQLKAMQMSERTESALESQVQSLQATVTTLNDQLQKVMSQIAIMLKHG